MFVRAFDAKVANNSRFLAVDPKSREIYTSSNSTVSVLSPDGSKHLRSLEVDGGKISYPRGVAFDTTGEVFVVQDGPFSKCRVLLFSSDGKFLRVLCGTGTGKGSDQFDAPHGVAVDGKGLVFVADHSNGRVQVFKRDGSFVRSIDTKAHGTSQPYGVAVSSRGEVFVSGGDILVRFVSCWRMVDFVWLCAGVLP